MTPITLTGINGNDLKWRIFFLPEITGVPPHLPEIADCLTGSDVYSPRACGTAPAQSGARTGPPHSPALSSRTPEEFNQS